MWGIWYEPRNNEQVLQVHPFMVHFFMVGICIFYCFRKFVPGNHAALQDKRDIQLGLVTGSLASQLRLDPDKDKDFAPLPGPLLRKYITYARNFVFPR
jgi:hypothetical protein